MICVNDEITYVSSKQKWFSVNLKDIWKYRDLIILFVKRDLTTSYKQTVLGPLWIIINPLLSTTVFTVIFGVIAGIPTDGTPQFLFYMSGNILWNFFFELLKPRVGNVSGQRKAVRQGVFSTACNADFGHTL